MTISRRSLLKTAISAAALTGATTLFGGSLSHASRPNIVFLLADDLRHDAVGYRNDKVQTPNLDRLAAQGLRFPNAFVTTSICAISRASIFTGMYARRHGICNFSTALSTDLLRQSYPALMKEAGYRTAFFGKYGVGDIKTDAAGNTLDAQLSAADRAAFDVIGDYGFAYRLPTRGGQHVHDVLAEDAENFIQSTSRTQPFCLSVSFVSPHERLATEGYDAIEHVMPAEMALPAEPDMLALYEKETFPEDRLLSTAAFDALPQFIRASLAHTRWCRILSDPTQRTEYVRRYYALVSGLDRVVGRIVTALKNADALGNTAIVFTSDNGFFLGDYQLHDKWFGYEPSIRVPLLVRPPQGVVARDIGAMALNIDLAPTLLSLAGVPIPAQMQGRDLTPLWSSRSGRHWRTDFLYEHFLCNAAGQPDLERERGVPSSEGVRNERYTYLRYPYQPMDNEVLIDRIADPTGVRNVIHQVPATLVQRLRKRTDELIRMNS